MTQTCVLCRESFIGYGNNPEPLSEGRCCNHCDEAYVIPARIHLATGNKKAYQQIIDFLKPRGTNK